jgi:hypothetical protein
MAGERPPEDPNRIPTGVELTALDPTFRTDPHPVSRACAGMSPRTTTG